MCFHGTSFTLIFLICPVIFNFFRFCSCHIVFLHKSFFALIISHIQKGEKLTVFQECPPSHFNPFVSNAPFFYPMKISENVTVFLCFQGVEKGCIGNKWVKQKIVSIISIVRIEIFYIFCNQKGRFKQKPLLQLQAVTLFLLLQ